MSAPVLICVCGHPRSRHKQERHGCRGCDDGCSRFEVDMEASRFAQAAAEATGGTVLFATGEEPGGGEYIGEVAEPVDARPFSERVRPTSVLAEVGAERDKARREVASMARRVAERIGERDVARAEAAQLRDELAELRAQLADAARTSWIVARDGGRHCERCEAEVRRGQAYEEQPGTGGLVAHIHCPDPEPAGEGDVLYAYDAWSCLTDGGCGSRYTTELATVDHRCGPLTPVRVTITHRSEGAPTA